MITVISLTITLVCSSLTLFSSILSRKDGKLSGSKLICATSGIVAACGIFLVATGGHWGWGLAAAMNLAIIYFRYPVKTEADIR